MSTIPDVLTDFEHRLTYATGEAQRAKVMLGSRVRWFLQRQANYRDNFDGIALPQLVEQAHVVVQLADVIPGSDTLGDDGREALEIAFDAAAGVAVDLDDVTEQQWARPEGTDSVTALWENLREPAPADPRSWTIEEIWAVAARAIRISAQLHGATFLYGDFFNETRWMNLQMVRGEFAFTADGGMQAWRAKDGKPTPANGLEYVETAEES